MYVGVYYSLKALKYLFSSLNISHLDSVSGVREPLDTLGNEERHLPCPSIPDRVHEDLGAVVLPLAPGVGPAQDHGVWLHAAQPARLHPDNIVHFSFATMPPCKITIDFHLEE